MISTCSLILKIDWVIQAKSPIIVLTLSLLSKTRIASFIKIGNHFYNTERFHDQNAKENENKGLQISPKKISIPFSHSVASSQLPFHANQTNNTIEDEGKDNKEEFQKSSDETTTHSKIGKRIKCVYDRSIILLILSVLYIISYFDPNNYKVYANSSLLSLEYLEKISNVQNNEAYNIYLSFLYNEAITNNEQILYLNKTQTVDKESLPFNLSNVQKENFLRFFYSDQYDLIISIKKASTIFFILSIVKTIFFIILMIFSRQIIISDSYQIILNSLEKMIEKYKDYVKNPLYFIHKGENNSRNIQNLPNDYDSNSKLVNEKMKLESTIINFGKLLSICFGEAGARII